MKIASVASALPENYYPQETLTRELHKFWDRELKHPEVLDRLHSNMGVDGRYLSLPKEAYGDLTTWGKANTAWIETGLNLGEQAISRALTRAKMSPRDLRAIFVVSVTGVASPTLDARLVNRMGLDPNIKRIPIFGLGCVAGAAGIARAADYVRAYPNEVAVLLSVELCSLTLQRQDVSTANIISAGLFGDGAAAVIVAGAGKQTEGPEILATRSVFYPDSEHVMGWDISEKGFQIVLSPDVPLVIRQHLANDVDDFLRDQGKSRADIGTWIMHTGGPKVLEATADALDLSEGALDLSWNCLRKTGNMSSASVLFVLEEVMTQRRPGPGTLSVLAAMGPGFCSELVLLRW